MVWRLCLRADRSCREKAQYQQLQWRESLRRHCCSSERADAAVRRSRRRLLHAVHRWVSRPDDTRAADLGGDAGTQPLDQGDENRKIFLVLFEKIESVFTCNL